LTTGQQKGAVLDRIIAARRERLAQARKRLPLERVQAAAERRYERRDFRAALAGGRAEPLPRVVAELKQASPSAGVLRAEYHARELAQAYDAGGADALSVLTEEEFFKGSLTDLIDARDAVGLPVLRKDFILDAYQVYESVSAGADALLLIVAAVTNRELRNLIELTEGLQLCALVEVHTQDELERALAAGARVIGINNRDLRTLQVSVETSFRLRERVPDDCTLVSESGIKTTAQMQELARAGFDAVLIGEQLVKAEDPGAELSAMLRAGAEHTQ
jgi:indole-3-glycerol phosphate synthase